MIDIVFLQWAMKTGHTVSCYLCQFTMGSNSVKTLQFLSRFDSVSIVLFNFILNFFAIDSDSESTNSNVPEQDLIKYPDNLNQTGEHF